MITPMCNKKPLAVSKGSADGADKDTADAVKALTAALEKSQMSLKVTYPAHPCLMCPRCTLATMCFPFRPGQHATPLCQLQKIAMGRQGTTSTATALMCSHGAQCKYATHSPVLPDLCHARLQEMSDVAALLEADLQAANAAAKVAAFKKEEDDAQALKCQQVRSFFCVRLTGSLSCVVETPQEHTCTCLCKRTSLHCAE